MPIDRKTILAVYTSCVILLTAVLLRSGFQNLEQTFLHPLDKSYSVLGSRSVFKDYLRGKKVYAFLPYWNLDDRDMNLDYITDLSYFGLSVNSIGRIIKDDSGYERWRKNKTLHAAIREVTGSGGRASLTLICHDDDSVNSVLSCRTCWQDLANDVIKELTWAGIKDVNIDFEHSGYTTKNYSSKYTELVGYLNKKLDAALGESYVTVSAYADSADKLGNDEVRISDPKGLVQVADAIFIMAYDFHRPTSTNAGPVSPLEGSYSTTKLNLTKTLDAYLQVTSASKLILGLPFYGYDWVVEDMKPMSARIEGSDYVGYSKSRTYAEVTDLLVRNQIKPLWDNLSKSPYFNYVDEETGSLRQVWYDNEASLQYKVDLALKKNLLGVGVWALGFEGGYSDLWKAFKPRI